MIVLCSTVHSPEAGLKWLSDIHLETLKEIFDDIIVVASPLTDKKYLQELKNSGVAVEQRKNNNIAKTYYRAIELGSKTNADYIFYCDFDRILHWVHTYKKELQTFVKNLHKESLKKKSFLEYSICERTKEGYAKHHEALFETEQIASRVINHFLGEKKPHDYFGGSFIFSAKAVKIILAQGKNVNGQEHWGYWPVLLKKNKIKVSYKICKGLEWETPDQYRKAVEAAGGLEKWREQLSSKEEWKRRTLWAREFVGKLL